MILIAAFTVGIGPVATAPACVAVLTAHLVTVGPALLGSSAQADDGDTPVSLRRTASAEAGARPRTAS